eukprot:137053_1
MLNTKCGKKSQNNFDFPALNFTAMSTEWKPKSGILFYQQEKFTQQQISAIVNHFNDDLSKAPKLLFADHAIDTFRNANQTRKHNKNQEKQLLGKHDRTFAYGIAVFFHQKRPSLKQFKTMTDGEFDPLKGHLLNGYDIVIHQPKKKPFCKYGKRPILHSLGVDNLPFAYVQYIQRKIDELRNLARSDRNVVRYYPNKQNIIRYDQNFSRYDLNNEDGHEQQPSRNYSSNSAATIEQMRLKQQFVLKEQQLHAQIEQAKIEKEKFRLKAAKEKQKRLKTEREHEEKQRIDNTPSFVSRSEWQWQDEYNQWQPYDNQTSQRIDALSVYGSYTFVCHANKQQYQITKSKVYAAVQRNVYTKVSRNVRRRLVSNATTKSEQMNQYPQYWDKRYMSRQNYATPRLVDLNGNASSSLVQEALNDAAVRFYDTVEDGQYDIIKIEANQNQMLYDKYCDEKKRMTKMIGERQLNEMYLFHGTKSESTMKSIEQEGFRKEFNNTAMYGKGTYFAKNASYSVSYAARSGSGVYKLFLCTVICGESHQGHMSYELTAWPKKANGLIFDSLVDKKHDPSIFVIHDDVKAYPLFVIHFKKRISKYTYNPYNQMPQNSTQMPQYSTNARSNWQPNYVSSHQQPSATASRTTRPSRIRAPPKSGNTMYKSYNSQQSSTSASSNDSKTGCVIQ